MWNAITFNGPLVNVDGSIKDIVGGYKFCLVYPHSCTLAAYTGRVVT